MTVAQHQSNLGASENLFKNEWSSIVEVREREKKRLQDEADEEAKRKEEASRTLSEEDTKTKLKTTEWELRKKKIELEESEKKLKSSEDSLKTSEEKVKASEDKLAAAEGKLKTSEERLSLSEEKLRTSDDKLKVSDGKLVAIEKSALPLNNNLPMEFNGFGVRIWNVGGKHVLDAGKIAPYLPSGMPVDVSDYDTQQVFRLKKANPKDPSSAWIIFSCAHGKVLGVYKDKHDAQNLPLLDDGSSPDRIWYIKASRRGAAWKIQHVESKKFLELADYYAKSNAKYKLSDDKPDCTTMEFSFMQVGW